MLSIKKCLLLTICFAFLSCSKDETNSTTNPTKPVEENYTFATNLNGYQFDGALKETDEPNLYKQVTLQHLEEYNDFIRVFYSSYYFTTNQYRWMVKSIKNGVVEQQYQLFEANPINYTFTFNNENFNLFTFEKSSYYTIGHAPDGKKTPFYVSPPSKSLPFKLGTNYSMFFNSPDKAQIFLFDNKLQSHVHPSPGGGYKLTSQPEVIYIADFLMNQNSTNSTEFRESIYTAFYSNTIDKGNFIGVGLGQKTLHTLNVNPGKYFINQEAYSKVFISEEGNKIYIGLSLIKSDLSGNELSLYEMDKTEKIIKPLYENKLAPSNTVSAFVRGQFFFESKTVLKTGIISDLLIPELNSNTLTKKFFYGKKRIIFAISDGDKRIELYSKIY